jgi:hypothetical protein
MGSFVNLFKNTVFFLFGAWVVASCTKYDEQNIDTQQVLTETPKLSHRSKELWNRHLAKVPFEKLQKECQPRRYAAQGELKGIVVLFHGYSACPQQFWELAPLLAEKGFEVYLPLLPGHGLKKLVKGAKISDDLSTLPKASHWDKYTELSDEMTALAKSTENVRHVVGGLSVGGALAAYSVYAPQNKGVWNRSLIMAPLFSSSEGAQLSVLDSVARLPLLDKIGYGWGPGCVKDSTFSQSWAWNVDAFTRGGFCDFQLTHLGAVQTLGEFTSKLIKTRFDSGNALSFFHQSQLVNTETDAKSRPKSLMNTNQWLTKVSTRLLDQKQSLKHSSCTWNDSVPHSFISRFDWPEVVGDASTEKKWLRGMILDTVKYITVGVPFPETSVGSSELPGHKMCQMNAIDANTYTISVPKKQSDSEALAASQY